MLRNIAGRWFRVPLGRMTAHGLIARWNGAVGLGYFFLGRIESKETLRPRDADLVARFGGYKLRDGSWPLLDVPAEPDVSRWPVPLFYAKPKLPPGALFVRTYDDRLRCVSERVTTRRPRGAIEDCMESPDGIADQLAELAKAARW